MRTWTGSTARTANQIPKFAHQPGKDCRLRIIDFVFLNIRRSFTILRRSKAQTYNHHILETIGCTV